MSETWHLDVHLAQAYADGRTDPVLTASLEQHVIGCAECRGLMRPLAPARSIDQNWAAVLERVQQPRPKPLERVLARLGVEASTARLLALTPSLRGSWLTGIVLVLLIAVLTAYADPRQIAAFLAIVPLLPAAGVAFAFAPELDASHEVAAAAPYPFVRLLAARTAMVIAATITPALLAGALLPGQAWLGVAWLLPGLALAAATLAIGTRVSPIATVVALALLWLAAIGRSLLPHGDPNLVGDPSVQALCAAVLAASVVVIAHDRHRLSEMIRRVS